MISRLPQAIYGRYENRCSEYGRILCIQVRHPWAGPKCMYVRFCNPSGLIASDGWWFPAIELRTHNITVNSYCPGVIITPLCESHKFTAQNNWANF